MKILLGVIVSLLFVFSISNTAPLEFTDDTFTSYLNDHPDEVLFVKLYD